LFVNLHKTHVVKSASSKLRTNSLNTVYNNRAVAVTENIKLLGMHMDYNLTWKSHVDNLTKKIEFDLLYTEEIMQSPLCICRLGSSVGIVTDYWLDGPRMKSRWGRDFLCTFRPALGLTQPYVQRVLRLTCW
jgi:hypothetical protein